MKHKAVIFDMDGVLIDSEKISRDLWIKYGTIMGIPEREMSDIFKFCLGMNMQDEADEFNKRYGWSYDQYKSFVDKVQQEKEMYRSPRDSLPLKSNAVGLLEALSGEDIKIALASSSTPENINRNLSGNNIAGYFEVIVSGQDVRHSKPDPEIYIKTAEKLGVQPSECLVIEDAPNGIEAAVKAGMDVIMVMDTVNPDEDTLGHVVIAVSHLFQIVDIIDTI